METHENAAASANNEREPSITKLTEIDGIARKTAEAMYEIGIHSYADLAQYLSQNTSEEVSEALKAQGVKRPPGFIDRETWTRQAKVLGQLENTAPTPLEEETGSVNNSEDAPADRDSRNHDAMFTVSFDIVRDEDGEPVLHTTVYDEKNAGQEEVFQGSDTIPWVNWILERADLPFPIQAKAPLAETEAVEPPVPVRPFSAQLKISDFQVSVIGPSSDVPEKRLKAEINFQLSGEDATRLTSQGLPFRIEVYTVDLESGRSELVASARSQLEPQVFEYSRHQKFPIPDEGRYELHSLVLLLPPGELVAHHRGPTMRVVP